MTVDLFPPHRPAFARMGVQPGDREAGRGDAEVAEQRRHG